MAKFTISLDKIIDEFKLETIYTPKNASEIEIDEADVTRPGLQLMGFYEYFNPERIQIIGKMEYAYLSTIDEETRVQRLDMLFSQRIPARSSPESCRILKKCSIWQRNIPFRSCEARKAPPTLSLD